ncbi:hypothetical protein AC792_10360 [Arthrobacter sp. RIT-PI-e]|nr:hypothetical protein AC792_10360 [Arthrobacter sp. RIT-PI-e]
MQVTNVNGRWPFVGREDEFASVRDVLTDETGRGVLLVGTSGIGKTTLAQQVIQGLAGTMDHIYLRGSASHSTVPYGALNVLLAELDEDTARNPLLVLTALQRRFDSTAASRPTVMHLDSVEDVDELSATVIAHLARVGAVRLLVTCENLLRAPGEFLDLWKDRVLERFDLHPLGFEATADLLGAALGNPVSRSAAQQQWSVSGGNPRYLQLATRADVESGHLFRRDGVWVSLDAPRPESGRSVADWSTAKLAELSPEDRAVVEVLAVSGPLPVSLLLEVAASTSLDTLQSAGMVTLEREDAPSVRLTYEVFADVVRAQLLSLRGRQALETIGARLDHPLLPAHGRVALTGWTLAQGGDLAPEDLVTAARLANDRWSSGAAEQFLAALPAEQESAAVAIERSRHLWIDGRHREALASIDPLLQAVDTGSVPLHSWAEAKLLAARLSEVDRTRAGRTQELLDDVAARLEHEPDDAVVADLRGRVDFLRVEALVFEGEYGRAAGLADTLLGTGADDSRWYLKIRSLLSLAQVSLGSAEQAVSLIRNVTTRFAASPYSRIDRDLADANLFQVLMLAGHWSPALDHARLHGGNNDAPLFNGSPSEFAEGVLLSYLGRSEEALAKLLPAISQFRIRDRHGLLPLAEAAAAYASMLENATDAAEDHLRAAQLTGPLRSWHLRECVQYFSLLTEAWLSAPDAPATEFLEHAQALSGRGQHGLALYFLAQAVQLGRHEAAQTLADVAAASDGPFAELCRGVAAGVLAKDAGMLREVARRALDAGNHTLASDVASLGIEYLSEASDPMIRVHAEQILRRTSTPARRHVRRKLLSERERAIARMVARGVPNKEIALQEHISPRTVEGHVHQIMTKLGLSSRKQLSLVFGQQQ